MKAIAAATQHQLDALFDVASHLDATESIVVDVVWPNVPVRNVRMVTEKHNCGGYGETVADMDGNILWQSSMNGCWQQSHQREELGNKVYAKLFTNECELVPLRVE